jgi:hypothetical protein
MMLMELLAELLNRRWDRTPSSGRGVGGATSFAPFRGRTFESPTGRLTRKRFGNCYWSVFSTWSFLVFYNTYEYIYIYIALYLFIYFGSWFLVFFWKIEVS